MDPDPAGFRVVGSGPDPDPAGTKMSRSGLDPDPKCQDPVRIRIRPDLKIVDPVHPYFPVASATSVEAAIKTKMAHFGYSGVRQHGLHVVHKYLFSISPSSIEDKQAFSVAVALYTRICS